MGESFSVREEEGSWTESSQMVGLRRGALILSVYIQILYTIVTLKIAP